jgi:type I restriction enzyme, R subunit
MIFGKHRDKEQLVAEVERTLAEARAFCTTAGVDVDAIFTAQKLARLTLISQAVEALVSPDDRRRGFFRVAGAAERAYKSRRRLGRPAVCGDISVQARPA